MDGAPASASRAGLPTPPFDPTGGSTRTPTAFSGGFDVDTLLWGAPTAAYDPGSAYSNDVRFDALASPAHGDAIAPLPTGLDRTLRHQRSASFSGAAGSGEDGVDAGLRRSSMSARRTSRGGTTSEWLESPDLRIGACGNVWGTLMSHAGAINPQQMELPHVQLQPSVVRPAAIIPAPPRRPPVVPLGRTNGSAVTLGSHGSGGSATTSSSRSSVSTAATSVASDSATSLPTMASVSPANSRPRATRRQHTDPNDPERPHICPEAGCRKTFKTNGHLIRHIRSHTGEKAFECLMEGCNQRFSRNDNARQHYRTHFPGGASRLGRSRKGASGPQRGSGGGSKKRRRAGSISDDSYESSDGASSAPVSPKGRARELPRMNGDDEDEAYEPAASPRPKRVAVPSSRALAARAHSADAAALAAGPSVVRPAPIHVPSSGVTHTLATALDVVHLQSPVLLHAPLPSALEVRQRAASPPVSRSSSLGSASMVIPPAVPPPQPSVPAAYQFDPRAAPALAAYHHQQRALAPSYVGSFAHQLPAYRPSPPPPVHSGSSQLAMVPLAAAMYADLPPLPPPVDALAAYRASLATHHARHAGPSESALMDDDDVATPPWLL